MRVSADMRWSVFLQVSTLQRHSDTVFSVAFSPNGKQIASGSQDKLVKIWDAETGAEVIFVGVS